MKVYEEMPLTADGTLSSTHQTILLTRLDDLLKFLGAPGDWGYGSKLGVMTQRLTALRREVATAPLFDGDRESPK